MKPRLVFTAAVFDMLHAGHLDLLWRMRELAGRGGLVAVILHDDRSTFANKKKFPLEDLDRRTRNVIASGYVDMIYHTFDQAPTCEFLSIISRFSAGFELRFMRGDDWADFPAKEILEECGVPIELKPYMPGISSSSERLVIERKTPQHNEA